MKTNKILFICTGNTCRSPMAQGIFQKLLTQSGLSTVECRSAGLAAAEGAPPSSHAVEACREIEIDISNHRSHQLTRDELPGTDLFAVMTPNHFRALEEAGVAAEKIQVLNVPDPFGGSLEEYRQCRDALSARLEALLQELENQNE